MSNPTLRPPPVQPKGQNSFTEPVTSAVVSGYRNVGSPASYTLYTIQVSGSVRSWRIDKRFSDFDDFHQALSEAFPSPPHPPIPATLPPKKFFSRLSEGVIKERKVKLEEYLNVLLQCPDARWRRSALCHRFLSVPATQIPRSRSAGTELTGRGSDPLSDRRRRSSNLEYTEIPDSETWVEECRDLQAQMTSIRQFLVRRESMITANGTNSGQVSQTLELQNTAKRMITDASKRITILQKSLQSWDSRTNSGSPGTRSVRTTMSFDLPSGRTGDRLWPLVGKHPVSGSPPSYSDARNAADDDITPTGPVLSAREISRRQDLLDQLSRDRDNLLKEVNKGAAELLRTRQDASGMNAPRRRVFGDVFRPSSSITTTPLSSSTPSRFGRLFGATSDEPDPTDKQKSMDTESVLKLQEGMFVNQDRHLDEITNVLRRQRVLGEAIGEELQVQNRLLDQIDDQVDKVERNMTSAERKIGKLG